MALARTREQDAELGQAMVEFALVLPILAVLTFGTLELALLIQQESAVTAASYMGARTASVLGNDATLTTHSVKTFSDASGWLKGVSLHHDTLADRSRFSAQVRTDGLVGLLSFLGGSTSTIHSLGSQACLPLEYTARKFSSSYRPTSKARTHLMIDYGQPKLFNPEQNKLNLPLKQASSAFSGINNGLNMLKKLPGFPDPSFNLQANLQQEPFTNRYAVDAKPRGVDNHGSTDSPNPDPNQTFAKDYFAADYEQPNKPIKPPVTYKEWLLSKELQTYETGLAGQNGQSGLNAYALAVKNWMKTASAQPGALAIIQAAQHTIGPMIDKNIVSATSRYADDKDKLERHLF